MTPDPRAVGVIQGWLGAESLVHGDPPRFTLQAQDRLISVVAAALLAARAEGEKRGEEWGRDGERATMADLVNSALRDTNVQHPPVTLETVRGGIEALWFAYNRMRGDVAAARADGFRAGAEAMRDTLHPWIEHKESCSWWRTDNTKRYQTTCSCGLDTVALPPLPEGW